MRAAIIAVGTELLSTDRTDTNSLRLAASLERFGVELVFKVVVGDDSARIERVTRELCREVDLVLVTGGLGPTTDDVTRPAVARATGRGLEIDPEIVADIERKFAAFGREMPYSNSRQAEVPTGAEVIHNRRGTAPGLRIEYEGTAVFLFPGVPRELEGMIVEALDPWLMERSGAEAAYRRTVRVACLPESEVEELLAPAYGRFGPIGVLASPGDVKVRLSAADPSTLEAADSCVRECLGAAVYGVDGASLERVVGEMLRDRGLTLVTAESCTGGWIAERITHVAGSSSYFLGGIIAYDDRIKREQLGVPAALIERHGAVSREVVEAMAEGANERLGSDWAVAVSGVAGPGGGSEEKPVGTVHVALARSGGRTVHRRLQLPGDRRTVRLLTTQWTLDLLRRELMSEPGA